MLCSIRTSSTYDGEAPLSLEIVELPLHRLSDVVVDPIDVGARPEPLAQVDRLHRLDGQLGGQRHVAEHVADVDDLGKREGDGEDLEPEEPVELKCPGEAVAAREEDRRLLSPDRDKGDD